LKHFSEFLAVAFVISFLVRSITPCLSTWCKWFQF